MKISGISKGKKRLFFYILLGIVLAYVGYQMISYYTHEEQTSVSMNFEASETNIISNVTATYTMKQGKGRLDIAKNFSDASELPNGCVSSFVELSTIDGDKITKAELVFKYEEKYLSYNENSLVAVRVSDDLSQIYPAETKIDAQNNTVTVVTSGEGKWALATR